MASIVDGDTLDVDGPRGRWRVRLIGINTPEKGECFAQQATEGLRSLTHGEIVLVSDVSDEDQYGRKLRYLETADGVDVGAEMVRNGLAISRRYEPDTARSSVYERAQTKAEAAGVGLWAADVCGPVTGSAASIDIAIRADADGDDNYNLNDEWVRFTNTGQTPIDLRNWQVADESASHRYTFGELTVAPNATVTLYTGCGADDDANRHWCNEGSAVWNNSGDTVFLKDPNGNIVVTQRYEGG